MKYITSGEVEEYNARPIAKGYSQQEGLDYTEIFSTVAKMVTIKSIIAILVSKYWSIFQRMSTKPYCKVIYLRRSTWTFYKALLLRLRLINCANCKVPLWT